MFERISALAAAVGRGGRDGSDGARRIRLSVVHGWRLALVAALRGEEAACDAALSGAFGLPVTATGRVAQALPGGQLLRIAPAQYWLVASQPSWLHQTVGALPAAAATVTDLSHSRVRVAISGPDVPRVLAKGITADLHPQAFRVGEFMQVGLHHSGVLLHRVGDDRYELYLPRTFALSLFEWLTDAAWQFGYDVGDETISAAS